MSKSELELESELELSKHYRALERMYLAGPIDQFYQSKITISEGHSEIVIDVKKEFFHGAGAVHGSVYFKLLDDAAFFAVNSIVKDVFVLTTNFNINLIRPENAGRITAIGKVKFKSKNLYIAESTLVNHKGKEIAFGTGHFTKSRIALTEKIGYK